MKMFRKLALGLLFIVAASLTGATTAMAQSRMYGSVNSFYNDLAPYGRWISNREYGEVWIPNVERDFQPYGTKGHWVMTEYGNTWVSDYEWGWAPFHYGRWAFDDLYGWFWVPGNEWGPAWVSWRSDNDYYGWAPLGPGIDINININIPLARWIFVPKRYIVHPNVYSYCVPKPRVVNVYRNTTVINNIYVNGNRRYVSGPHRDDIERYSRQKVNVYRIENNNRPSRTVEREGSLRVYRPEAVERPQRPTANSSRIQDQRYDRRENPVSNNNNNNGPAWNSRERSDRSDMNERVNASDRGRSQAERYSRQQSESADRSRPEPSSSGTPSPGQGRYQRPSGPSVNSERQGPMQRSTGPGVSSSRDRSSGSGPSEGGNSSRNSGQGSSRGNRPTRG